MTTESSDHHNKQTKSKSIGQYMLGKTIGEGTFGKVRIGTHILTGEKVAVKVLEKDRITDVSDVERVAREIHILKIIRHPNIIQLYEIVETTKQLYLITEYMSGGELYEYIVANNRIKEPEACRLFQQVISGVEYIHKLNIVHRDLKPENLLLDFNKNVRIVDFGLSNTYKQGEKLKTACGSPCYAAPEMIAGKKYNGLQVDIWSAGVVLFALLCGYLPFEDPNTANLYKKILSGDYTIPKFLSPQAKEMIKGILNIDPIKRFTIEDIRKHPWFSISQITARQGIIVGVHQIPTEPKVLKELEKYGFSPDYTQKCVEANKHNPATTTYYLLLQKFIREGGKSPADLTSPLFEPITIGRRLHTLRETPHLEKLGSQNINLNSTSTSPFGQLTQSTPHPPSERKSLENVLNSKNRKYIDPSESKKLEGTGGSSSKDNDIIQKKDSLSGALTMGSPKMHTNARNNYTEFVPHICATNDDNMNDFTGDKLKDYMLNLSFNVTGEKRKAKLNESLDLNVTGPLRRAENKLRLPGKEERSNSKPKKPLSTRAQALIGARLGKKKISLFGNTTELRNNLLNNSVTPSVGSRESSSKPPSCTPNRGMQQQNNPIWNNFAIVTKTYRPNSKNYAPPKTPNRMLKYFFNDFTKKKA